MEFVGKSVRKEFKGFGVFEGVVESYDSSTGFFKILYEDGDSEEVDFSEVSCLISGVVKVVEKVEEPKKVGRKKAKKRLRSHSGIGNSSNSINVLGIDSDSGNCNGIDDHNDVNDVNGSLSCLDGNEDGFDLNRLINSDDGEGNGEFKGGIDLNLSVNDEGVVEDGVRVAKEGSLRGNKRGFDLNLGINEESVNGNASIILDNNECVGLGQEVKNGEGNVVDANSVNNRVCEANVEESGNNSGRRKMRKVDKTLNSPTETVLRRSARRAKALALHESNVPSPKLGEEVNDLPLPVMIDEIEEQPVSEELETVVEPQVSPDNIVFPPSSMSINLEGIPVLDFFSIYSCLRSFSILLYLSPFEMEDFVAALKNPVSNPLIDFIHVSILQTLRKHLELLAIEGCESASTCLRSLNWDLLDLITWPVFMAEYLLIHGSGLKPGFNLNSLKLFDGEYYKQPPEVKIELLRCLCDDVLEVEAIRTELSKRTSIVEANMEKRRLSVDIIGDSCLNENLKLEVDDGNSDECRLCKMDGNLICCDGCPAAYHSKCVGVVDSLLPEGNWYCPECAVKRKNSCNRTRKIFQGAELLGIDPEGRSFFGCFDYLLVSDSYDAEGLCCYYHKDDLGAVIQLLSSSTTEYRPILSAISEHWDFVTDLCQPKDFKPYIEAENPHTSSEGSGEVLQENGSTQKSRRGQTTKKGKKKCSSFKKVKSYSNEKEEDMLKSHLGDAYVNNYSFARIAASIVEELLRKPSGKANIEAPKTEEEIIAIQSKFILNKSEKSCWPTIQNLNGERQKQICGWCYCCRFPVEGRGCLCIFKNTSSIPVGLKAEIDGLVSKRNKKGHLVDVISYILRLEERLRGFLLGPWLKPQYSEIWRQRVLKASDFSSLKLPLLTLESNLRSLAILPDWWKHIDLVTKMGSATHFVVRTKNGISKKKVKYPDSETKSSTNKSSTPLRGLIQFWWRGGKTSRSLFHWKVVPRSSALKAARKGGCIKIPDVHYLDAFDIARRTKCVAWRASVETSKSLEQLALQIREFDLFIRWNDIENTHPHSLLDKESIKSIRLFKKVIVRRKCLEGTVPKYLMDFGKRRCIPDVVLKHGKKVEDPECERKRYWLDEVYVPLYLLRSFEERRIARKAGKKTSSKSRTVSKVVKKPLREKGFDYLFSRAERVDSYQCGHCNKNVSVSEAVTCQLCDGYFHKRHVIKLSGGITSGCTYTCHKCRAGKSVKKERNLRKRKFGELQEAKSLKVESVGSPAKSRGRPKKKGKLSANHRQVPSRNAKKKKNLEQTKNNKIPPGIPLRRSARKAKWVIPNPKKVVGGKKKKSKPRKETQRKETQRKERKERVSRKPKNVASKETSESVSWQKKRTMTQRLFWFNGLLLSEKPNDERVLQFKRWKLLVSFDSSIDIDDQPKCSLCSQQRSTSGFLFIACEICGDWFHGDAFGLNKEKCENLAGFKCHVCLEKSPPICPFVDISRDNHIIMNEAMSEAHDAQELPLVVAIGKETNCMNEGPSDFSEVHTTQKSNENLDKDENLVLDNNVIIENGSHTSNEGSRSEVVDTPGLPDVLADLKETYCDQDSSGLLGLPTSHSCDGNLDRDEIPMLDVDSRLENGLPFSNELQCNKTSSNESMDAQELPVRKKTDCVSELSCNKDISAMFESHTEPICNENLGRVEITTLHYELSVENTEASNKELHCNEDSTSEAQVCDGILDQGGTPKQDLESRLENGSNQDKATMLLVEKGSAVIEEVVAWSNGSQDVDMEVKSEK